MSRRTRLTTRGKVVFGTLLAALLIVLGFILGPVSQSAFAGDEASQVPASEVVVMPGDTLWDIALEAAPNSDPREVMNAISQVNELESSELQIGTRLTIPAGL